jgi:hypothetical protein
MKQKLLGTNTGMMIWKKYKVIILNASKPKKRGVLAEKREKWQENRVRISLADLGEINSH